MIPWRCSPCSWPWRTVLRRRRFQFVNKAEAAEGSRGGASGECGGGRAYGEDAVEGAEGAVGVPRALGGRKLRPRRRAGRGGGCCACARPIPRGGVCPRGFYAGERCCLQCARPVPGDGVCPRASR